MPAVLAFRSPAPADLTPQGREWRREALLSGIGAEDREIQAAEARKLVAITAWADLHRTDAAESFADESLLPGHDQHSMPIVMAGVPVEEYCLAELATAMRVSHGAARARTEQALELRERLPRLWGKVHAAKLPAWMALVVAKETLSLSDEAAEFVDRQLAPFARTLTLARIKRAVAAAILRFDPERAAAEAAAASDGRGVWFDLEHGSAELPTTDARPDGVGRCEIVGSVPDLLAFEDALNDVAGDLKVLGDESPEQVRRAKAVGILADSQHRLDLGATARAAVESDDGTGEPVERRRPSRARTPLGVERPIHVHLHTSTQVARLQTSGLPHAASPVAREAIERWIADLAPGAKVKVTPVVDLNRHHAVDAYEAPDFTRALVEERDHTCVFPFCTNRGRFDLDHIEAHVDPDDGGPPGQTSNYNLAKLCRYHHRAKTHTTWTYRRVDSIWDLDPAGPDPWTPTELSTTTGSPISAEDRGGPAPAYAWTSPLGFHFLVTATGTYPLD
jgi:hypothetical protein